MKYQTYETEINVSFNYGAQNLIFSKEFDLPFIVFYNLTLSDEKDGYINEVKICNNDCCVTTISYNTSEDSFEVYVRNIWKSPVSDETIDDIINRFKNTNWSRDDSTNIDDLKNLMKKDR